MTPPARLLFLEVDAGDKVLVQQWARDGTLPTFARLLREGLVGDSQSVDGFFVGATWPSLYTGANPANHGIHSLVQLKLGTYEFFRCYPGEQLRREPFWDVLSREGRRVAVLDFPLSALSPGINGIQSVEWGAHDANYGFCATPAAFEADLRERFGLHPLPETCNGENRSPAEIVELRDKLVRGARQKAKLSTHYLAQGGWDFFGQVFTESHCIGHQCWHLHDAAHPAFDAGVAEVTGDPMREVYRAIDAGIGEILDCAGPEATVIVLLGHRMAHKFGVQFLLPKILAALDVATLRTPEETAVTRLDDSLTRAWQSLSPGLRRTLGTPRRLARSWLDARRPRGPLLPPSVTALDAAKSHVFMMDSGFPASGLRLNLAGREPAGLIAPGDADAFCDRLAADLLELVYPDTGEPVVARVRRTVDLYRGDHLDLLPDLLVEWDDRRYLGSATCGNPRGSEMSVRSTKTGLVSGVNRYCRTGDHRRDGMFIALSPRLRPGRLERTISIMDFAPTFCAMLGATLPGADGEVIHELVGGDLMQRH
jgi:predicted AlkP superfamily phosphohydrolase/phosphomutase